MQEVRGEGNAYRHKSEYLQLTFKIDFFGKNVNKVYSDEANSIIYKNKIAILLSVDENSIGASQIGDIIWCLCYISQYCNSIIGQFSITLNLVIALPTI